MRTQRGDGMLGLLWHSAQLGSQKWPWCSFLLEAGCTPRLLNVDRGNTSQLGSQKWPWYSFLLEAGCTLGLLNMDRRNTSLVTCLSTIFIPAGLELRLPVVRSGKSSETTVANLWECLRNCFAQFRFSIRKKRPQPVAVFWLSYNTEFTLSYAFMPWDWHGRCFTVSIASCVGHFCSAKCAQPPVEVLIQVY